MSRKRRQPKTTQPVDPLAPESLKAAQAKHFRALESWALNQQATVCGVPIILCLNYDLVQITNQAYLGYLLPPPVVEQKEETSVNDPV